MKKKKKKKKKKVETLLLELRVLFKSLWMLTRSVRKTFECRGPHNAEIKLAGNFAGSLL